MSWKEQDDQLIKVFTLDGFSEIAHKLVEVARIADDMDHHPDVEVFGYKHIRFRLCTHSEGTVTSKDYTLADEIDKIFD